MPPLLLYISFVAALIPYNAFSEKNWDNVRFDGLTPGITYDISTGSGFFVNDNHIITNAHVVPDCLTISARGAIAPTRLELVAKDINLDLALLYSPITPLRVPYLRVNYAQILHNEDVFVGGYPLEHGKTGEILVASAKVIEIKYDPITNLSNMLFTDVVEEGNSGGPVVDRNGNIVGVVVAEIDYFNRDTKQLQSSIGQAIGLDTLISFLNKNNVFYASNSTYDIFTNYNTEASLKEYIVNIHCVCR